jgi:hypothetical protein
MLRFSVAVTAWLALGMPGCAAAADECRREPAGAILAFLDIQGEQASVRFEGRLLEVLSPTDLGIRRYRFRDASGKLIVLSYRSPLGPLPLREGSEYGLQVDYVGGSPEGSALAIHDAEGLLFAGGSGQRIGAHVLTQGLPGFALELLPTECESRRSERCYEAIYNLQLRVAHQGATAVLHQGDSTQLGRYQVSCLTAQHVVYSKLCADAGLHAFSYAIQRIE